MYIPVADKTHLDSPFQIGSGPPGYGHFAMKKDEDDEKKMRNWDFLELHLLKTVGNPDYIISSERTQSLPRLDDQQPHFSCVDLLDTGPRH